MQYYWRYFTSSVSQTVRVVVTNEMRKNDEISDRIRGRWILGTVYVTGY